MDEKTERRERIKARLDHPYFKFDAGDCWDFITEGSPDANPATLVNKIEAATEKFRRAVEDALGPNIDKTLRDVVAWWGDTLEDESSLLLGSGKRRGKMVAFCHALPSGKPGDVDHPLAVFSSVRDAVDGVVSGSYYFDDFTQDDARWWAQHFRDCAEALDQFDEAKLKRERENES